MKRIAAFMAMLSLLLTACSPAKSEAPAPVSDQSELSEPVKYPEGNGTTITLTIGEQTFSATLLENESTHQLLALFPMTLDMNELNGNEKYFYLDGDLPVESQQPGQINAGDLMLYGNNCLVLFYETFSSGYSYTRLGSVDDPAGLVEALGTGGVTVSFAIED